MTEPTNEGQIQNLFDRDRSSTRAPADLVDNVVAVSRRRTASMDMLHFGIGPLFATLLHILAPLVRLLAPVMVDNTSAGKNLEG